MSNPVLTPADIKRIVNTYSDKEMLELYKSYLAEERTSIANILRTEYIRNKVLSDSEWVWTEALVELIEEESNYLSDFNTTIFCSKGNEPFTIARRNAFLSFSRINMFLTVMSEECKEKPNNWNYVYIFNKEWDLVCNDINRKQLVMYLLAVLAKDDTYAYTRSLPHYADRFAPEFGAILRAKEMNRDYERHVRSIEERYEEVMSSYDSYSPEGVERVMGVSYIC